jgi:hypothetical protein
LNDGSCHRIALAESVLASSVNSPDENSRATSTSCQSDICEFESSHPRHGFVDLATGIGVTKCRGGMRGNSGSFLTLASFHAICERGAVDFAQSSNCRHGLYVLNWTFKLRRQPYSTWYRGGSFWSFRQLILMTAVATHLVANAAHGHAAAPACAAAKWPVEHSYE